MMRTSNRFTSAYAGTGDPQQDDYLAASDAQRLHELLVSVNREVHDWGFTDGTDRPAGACAATVVLLEPTHTRRRITMQRLRFSQRQRAQTCCELRIVAFPGEYRRAKRGVLPQHAMPRELVGERLKTPRQPGIARRMVH